MPLEGVIIATVCLIFVVLVIGGAIISLIEEHSDDPSRSKIIFVTALSTVWIIVAFVACVWKAWSAGDFDREPKSEPQTESSAPKLDYEK